MSNLEDVNLINKENLANFKGNVGTRIAFATGRFTSVGGDVNEAISVPGLEAGDIVVVTIDTVGATPRTIVSAVAAADVINVVLSGDPSNDHVLGYVCFKAAL